MADFTIRLAGEPIRINLGESTEIAARERVLAEDASAEAQESAAFAEEFSGPAYSSQAAGEAATTTGQFFRVSNGDTPRTYTRYQRTSGGSVVAAPLATTSALNSNEPDKGINLLGEPSVPSLLTSSASPRGAGSIWHADGYRYAEAASGATDQHITTAGGVKLYALPDKGGLSAEAFPGIPSAVSSALASGVVAVNVSDDYSIPSSFTGRSNVFLQGTGSIAGGNQDTPMYRREVVKPTAGFGVPQPDRWTYSTGKKTLTVVVVGDSLATYGADAISVQDGFTTHLERVLKASNPGKTVNVISRAIGAQTYGQIDSTPSVGYTITDRYPWYTNPARAWLEYVADLSPDIVVLSSGMNDKQNFARDKFESVVTKVRAMASKPEVVVATNMVPNLSPDPDFVASYATYADQEGRDYVAGWVRTWARYNGVSLIDINRTFNIVRDGRDILNTYFEEVPEVTFGSASEWIAAEDERCRDFTLRATIATAAWTSGTPFYASLSDENNNVVFMRNNGGFLEFAFYRGGTSSLYQTLLSTIPTPSSNAEVEIAVRGEFFTFRIIPATSGAEAGAQPFTARVIRYGGLFRPRLSYFSAPGTGPVLAVTLGVGKEQQFVPRILDRDMWGIPDDTADTRAVTGGNGINHPTSEGANLIYGMHFAAQRYDLRAVASEVTTTANGYTQKFDDGVLICQLTVPVNVASTGSQAFAYGDTFIEKPALNVSHLVTNPHTALYLNNIKALTTNTTQAVVSLIAAGTSVNPAADTEKLFIVARGRWK